MHLDEIYVTLYITDNLDEVSCHDDNLDETYAHTHIHDTWELDDEYARDSCDYTQLAYTYFA